VMIAMNDAEFDRHKVGLFSLTMSSAKESAITPQLAGVWGKLQSSFDMIIIAAPPVLDDPTAACLGSLVDGNVLIVSSGASREKQVARAIDLLTSGATPLLGVIMTDRKHTLPRWIRWIFRQQD
jgi:Mrp family chromosome partitioning ATPase